ncbi:MAG TPA: cytochrome c oxidase assembly protein [Gemmatimonadales bacterium]
MIAIALLVHEGAPLAPHDVWSAWSGEPGVLLSLGAMALLYAIGWRRRRGRTGRGRGARRREAAAFWGGWIVLAVALVSPLHRMGGALLWGHMAQHVLLMVVAAPLLVLGRPVLTSLWAVPRVRRRQAGAWLARLGPLSRLLGRLEVAWLLHAVAILVWHTPSLYGRTVDSELIHSMQHASFLGSALLYWWSVLTEARTRARHGGAILSLFTTMIYSGGLGALLTVAERPWYPAYGAAAPFWGLTPLEDQQLAGLIMWVPAGLSYLVATLWLMAAWLRDSEGRVVRRERVRAAAASLPTLLLVALAACETRPALSAAEAAHLTGGDAEQGRLAFRRFGCGTCHTVDGVPGANGLVGPPLDGVGARVDIAGVLVNTPEHLSRWIQSPREVDARTAMPDLGVSAAEARDIAAFLCTRR